MFVGPYDLCAVFIIELVDKHLLLSHCIQHLARIFFLYRGFARLSLSHLLFAFAQVCLIEMVWL